jgi:hypothetical protein
VSTGEIVDVQAKQVIGALQAEKGARVGAERAVEVDD